MTVNRFSLVKIRFPIWLQKSVSAPALIAVCQFSPLFLLRCCQFAMKLHFAKKLAADEVFPVLIGFFWRALTMISRPLIVKLR